jgi:hypothetical protein
MKADEAAGETLAEFDEAFGGGHVVGVEGIHQNRSRYGLRRRSI